MVLLKSSYYFPNFFYVEKKKNSFFLEWCWGKPAEVYIEFYHMYVSTV